MKKKYVKPDIVFQNFRLSTELCEACYIKAVYADYDCPIVIEDFPYTLITEFNCEAYAPEITDTLCYHVPIEDYNVFSS